MTACKRCGVPVLRALIANTRKPIDLDPEPSEAGTYRVRWREFAELLTYRECQQERALRHPLYVPHVATCANAHGARLGSGTT